MDDLLIEAFMEYEREIQSRCPDDYEVAVENMSKLMSTYYYISQLVEENGGRVDELKFDRRITNGGITAYFRVLNLDGDNIQEFCNMIKNASAITIDALLDGTVCLSMTFNDVFRRIS